MQTENRNLVMGRGNCLEPCSLVNLGAVTIALTSFAFEVKVSQFKKDIYIGTEQMQEEEGLMQRKEG